MQLFDRRFVLFTGKGGVGKTTIASAFALRCAQQGQKTLLIQVNVKDKLSSLFGSSQVGSDIVEVEDRLFAVNTTPAAAIEEYALMILRLRVVYKAVFENRIIQTFLRALPGLNELVMLGKAYFHAVEKHPNGDFVWDKIVVDLPATGHGIFFLQIPQVVTSLIQSGHMYEEAQRILDLLQDPQRTALNLVTLAEEMPVNECVMLHQAATEKLNVPLGFVFANGLIGDPFSAQDHEWIDALGDQTERTEELRGLIEAANHRRERAALQARYLDQLRDKVPLPILTVADQMQGRMDFAGLQSIADEIGTQIGEGSTDA